jgi:hypothetical protein
MHKLARHAQFIDNMEGFFFFFLDIKIVGGEADCNYPT